MVSGGTYRPLALARAGARNGWKMLVVAQEPDYRPSAAGVDLLGTVPPEVEVVRVVRPSLSPPPAGLPRLDGGFLTALAIVARARQAFRRERPRAILASGPPFHVFVAGYYLARHFRRPLVLEYRDEWTQNPFDFVTVDVDDARWERRCLRAASAVIFTTRSQLEHHARTFPEVEPARRHLIPNGWDPVAAEAGLPSPPAPGRLTISYVGHLGLHTPPDRFLDTLGHVLRRRPDLRAALRIRFVGWCAKGVRGALERFAFQEILDVVPLVPKREADGIMRASTALLLLNDERLERYIPGKLYEYLAARRPVLVFGQGGESARLVDDLRAGPVVPAGDAVALEEALDRLREDSAPAPSPRLASWLAEHNRERLSARTLDLLERIAPARRVRGA